MMTLRKIAYGFPRIFFYIKDFPRRIYRILAHILSIFSIIFFQYKSLLKNCLRWSVELLFLVMDLIAVPDIYEFIIDVTKSSSRPLSEEEKIEAKRVFADSIDLNRVRVDNKARIGSKKHQYAYVSFYTINLYGFLSFNLLIHELTHVWQYSQFGSVYIPRALYAQKSEMKYNYGGLSDLENTKSKGFDITSYNYEQQADIVSDYYRLLNSERVQWGNATNNDIALYQHFISAINENAGGLA